jgi:hypothetical protein
VKPSRKSSISAAISSSRMALADHHHDRWKCATAPATRPGSHRGAASAKYEANAAYPNAVFTAVVYGEDRAKFGTPRPRFLASASV